MAEGRKYSSWQVLGTCAALVSLGLVVKDVGPSVVENLGNPAATGSSTGENPFSLKKQTAIVDTGGLTPSVDFSSGAEFAKNGKWNIPFGAPGNYLTQHHNDGRLTFSPGGETCVFSVKKSHGVEKATLKCEPSTASYISGKTGNPITSFVVFRRPSVEQVNRTKLALAA